MMSQDVQKLHDAVLLLGDAALEIATALSAFTKEEGDGTFKRPGDPKPSPVGALLGNEPWIGPPIAGTGTGFVEVVPTEEPQKEEQPLKAMSYISGEPMSELRAEKREAARRTAERAGYDYKHWCEKVRHVRIKKFNLRASGLGDLVGVSGEAVHSWEAGVCFAKVSTRERLERISNALAGTPPESWKKPKCD